MEPVIGQLDIHSNSEAFQDHMERFEILSMTRKGVEDDKIVANFLISIWNYAYRLLNTLTFSGEPILLAYTTLKQPLPNHVNFRCHERAKSHKMVRQKNQNVTEFIYGLLKQAIKCDLHYQPHVYLCNWLLFKLTYQILKESSYKSRNVSSKMFEVRVLIVMQCIGLTSRTSRILLR